MKALCWQGKHKVTVETVPDPTIQNPKDAIIKITTAAICGSDLHLYDGYQPTMEKGDILGHENMGVVVEVGKEVKKLKVGDRVVVPFVIACGECFFCKKELYSCCDNTNPNAEIARKAMGHSPAGLFGFSHMLGGYSGGQAQYLRVPHADVGPIKIEDDSLRDEQVLFLSDIFPTGYMAVENCGIEPGDTVAIWGAGPVGQMAVKSAKMLGAERVILIDQEPSRLKLGQTSTGVETIDFSKEDVYDRLLEMTGGRGPDRCVDAVGCEACAGKTVDGTLDAIKTTVGIATDRIHVLRQAIMACRKAGTISIPGVYVGMADNLPLGPLMNKGLTIKSGQTHVQRYLRPLLDRIQNKEIDPSFIISHTLTLDEAPKGYEMFKNEKSTCTKVVLKPNGL